MNLSEKSLAKIEEAVNTYPGKISAILPILHIVQDEIGHVPLEVQEWVAEKLGLTPVYVRGVVTFYEMFHEGKIGRYLILVCKTLSCQLVGAEAVIKHLEKRLKIKLGGTTADNMFTLNTVECLACCDKGPAMMVNDDLYTELTPAKIDEIIATLR